MTIYKYILEQGKIDNEKGTTITGVSADGAFIRAFRSQFYMTPTEAVEQKDFSLLLPIARWENITEYDRLCLEAEKSKSHYKLNERECALAFDIYKANRYDLEEVFEYVYSYVWKFAESGQDEDERDRNIEYYLPKREALKMFFDYRFSMDTIFGVLVAREIKMIDRPFEECDKMYLEGASFIVFDVIEDKWGEIYEHRKTVVPYEENRKFFSFYEESYQYYIENADEQYTHFDFLHYIFLCCYADKAVVLSNMKPGIKDYESLYEEIEQEKRRIIVIDNNFDPEQAYLEVQKEMEQELREIVDEWEKKELYGEVDEEDWEDYTLSSLECDMYNPDFGEEGYQPYYDDDMEYDYEPDLDDSEWLEDQYLSQESEDLSALYMDVIKTEDRMDSASVSFDVLCKTVCEAMQKESDRKKLHRHSNFDVKEFLNGQVKEWNDKGCPYYTKKIEFGTRDWISGDTDLPFC